MTRGGPWKLLGILGVTATACTSIALVKTATLPYEHAVKGWLALAAAGLVGVLTGFIIVRLDRPREGEQHGEKHKRPFGWTMVLAIIFIPLLFNALGVNGEIALLSLIAGFLFVIMAHIVRLTLRYKNVVRN